MRRKRLPSFNDWLLSEKFNFEEADSLSFGGSVFITLRNGSSTSLKRDMSLSLAIFTYECLAENTHN